MRILKDSIRRNSFAARLTPEQRDELFDLLEGGLSYGAAAEKVRGWIKANDETGLNGASPGREIKLTEATTIRKWYRFALAERRHAAAREAATAAQTLCPFDYEAQGRFALGQAWYLATLEDLRVTDIAALRRIELARDKLAFQREKDARDSLLKEVRELVRLSSKGHRSEELQSLIDTTLAEIERMKLEGREAARFRNANMDARLAVLAREADEPAADGGEEEEVEEDTVELPAG